MTTITNKGPVVDRGKCRCCGERKKCRLLTVQYEWSGQQEVYSDMIIDCFGLVLSHLDGKLDDRLICATCVTRLREAVAFRDQVVQSQQKLHTVSRVRGKSATNSNVKAEWVEIELEETTHEESGDYPEEHIDNDENSSEDSKGTSRNPLDRRRDLKGVKGRSLHTRSAHEDRSKPRPGSRSHMDSENKAITNTASIVACSYVCPFDTSFSDYYCYYCREVFTDPCKLREHTLAHDPTTYKEHINTKKIPQIDVLRVDCRLCPKTIDNIDALKRHLSSTHGILLHDDVRNEFLQFKLTMNALTCIECKTTFGFFHALKKHMAEHFGTCICHVCGAHFFTEKLLVMHQRIHQKSNEPFPCDECGKILKSKRTRRIHIATTHKKEPIYKCNKCNEVFLSYSLRLRHMINIHGERRVFSCELCDRAYDNRKSLREHIRRRHTQNLELQCDLCDRRLSSKLRLKEHMATHTGERNFRCEYCGKSYSRLRVLKVHMQSHNSEKKYRCVLCSASFSHNVSLKNHVRRQHQDLEMQAEYLE